MTSSLAIIRRCMSTASSKRSPHPKLDRLKAGAFVPRPSAPHIQTMVDEMLRVDHAGEYGAVQIYKGQLAFTRDPEARHMLEEMRAQEETHLRNIEILVPKYRARPTVLLPFWHVAGYGLGAVTAVMGKEMAMACTVAVEEVITEHYDEQLRQLHAHKEEWRSDELRSVIKANRDDEEEHRHIALEHGAEQAPFYQAATTIIKTGCQAAIWIAKRV